MSFVSPLETESYVYSIANQILNVDKVDYSCIVAPVRGGLIPGVMLSHALKKPLFPISFSLRDHKAQEDIPVSWLKYAYEHADKPVLLIDDIIDSGATFALLLAKLADAAPEIHVATAALLYNVRAPIGINYCGHEFDRDEYKEFFDFYWELL